MLVTVRMREKKEEKVRPSVDLRSGNKGKAASLGEGRRGGWSTPLEGRLNRTVVTVFTVCFKLLRRLYHTLCLIGASISEKSYRTAYIAGNMCLLTRAGWKPVRTLQHSIS